MLTRVHERGFKPRCVAFDSWFRVLTNLKLIASYSWIWLTRLKRNRLVNADQTGNRRICDVAIAATGTVVQLISYGFIRVFKIVATDGDIDYWATNDLKMSFLQRQQWADFEWSIEEYHARSRAVLWSGESPSTFGSCEGAITLAQAIRAFLRLDIYWFNTGISWYESKVSIVREAVRSYLAAPWLSLPPTA
ncbi:hypothetical protein [Kamptonema sp. UHCC 0994]|uniref:hypothetical protein n=1 Tax=Kamptonema sp. UHCC 0994 TaxID=3031329 RepID=UPI0023B926D6|nr:hypothetical protein [Kamptonema sp. UHCC 0994]MDF0555633.1 hypothetical protein [Kamptonema sp. UHCC 0994]